MPIQEKLDDAKVGKVIASFGADECRVFEHTLAMLALLNEQAGLLLDLAESTVFQKLKEDPAMQDITTKEHGFLLDCVPWGFSVKGEWSRRKNTAKYKEMKDHFAAVKKLLGDTVTM